MPFRIFLPLTAENDPAGSITHAGDSGHATFKGRVFEYAAAGVDEVFKV